MSAEAAAVRGFVGRTRELERVRAVLDGARAGRAGALLVLGDAGVGKTRLVGRACAEPQDDDVLVEAACLPLSTARVPCRPLRTALRRLPAELGAPSLAVGPDGGPGVGDLDDWVDRVCAEGRTVLLVVDDVHWADGATLDALMYLLAGPADRRLALLLTVRHGEVGSIDPLRRWLADARRMPSFGELPLAPFDREGTRNQLAAVLGTPPHESLVNDVHARSGGNAYLTRLLVEGLTPDARHLPTGLPDSLADAVLRPWHDLSVQARALVLTIAIGGEVAGERALARAVQLSGVASDAVPALLHQAVEAGVLDVSSEGGYWFHHPLQAEVLEARLAPHERRSMHAVLAQACEADLAHDDGALSPSRLVATTAVAEHHARAEHHVEAFRWTLRAADLADRLDDGPALLSLLRRVVDLHQHVPDADASRAVLLTRLMATACQLGDHETEFGAVEALLELVDEHDDPLLATELLVRQEHLRFSTGRGFIRLAAVQHAADLSCPWPDSWQHGYALAEVGHASLWADDAGAQDAVAAAVARADVIAEPRVSAYSYAAAAMGATFAKRPDGAALAAKAVSAAVEARDWWAFVHASLWEANAVASPASPLWARRIQGRREQLEHEGGAYPYIAFLSAVEAGSWLHSGAWKSSSRRLRVALGSDPGVAADVITRLVAARLGTLQGRQPEAEAHLARAEELFADTTGFRSFEFDAVRALVRLGGGDPAGAVDAATTGATSPGAPPTMCEWLLPLAARGLADLTEQAREAPSHDDHFLAELDRLVTVFPRVIRDNAVLTPAYERQLAGLDALYAAEVARAHRSPGEGKRWADAVRLLEGVLPWEEAYAAYRAGECALTRGRGARDEAASMVRRAHALARDLQAEPVLREVLELARSARIVLHDVAASAATGPVDERLLGLTAREREVLDHVVAGLTYGEIARALFVSEKTVSSHISNLLRKTGTANRHDLARLARHHAAPAPPAAPTP